ncbi:sulfotransferase [Aestuariibacter sp. GS-14]|nr:sulfotransferase [Aestuariibacter sp. GS-14]
MLFMQNVPNFFLIGAAKCGTTSIADYLNQHPEVYFSAYKEPNYFALVNEDLSHPGPLSPKMNFHIQYSRSLVTEADYEQAFVNAGDAKIRADASVRYLYYPKTAQRIAQHAPDAKLIAVLREPVSRLYSHYCMNVQFQTEPLSLQKALESEDSRVAAGWGWDWHYTRLGRYTEQLERYYQHFDKSQLLVILYDDLVKHPLETYHRICRHLGISDTFTPDMSKRGKVPTQPRSRMLDRWLNWPDSSRKTLESWLPPRITTKITQTLSEINNKAVPKLSPSLHQELASLFYDEATKLETLLERKIPWYKSS